MASFGKLPVHLPTAAHGRSAVAKGKRLLDLWRHSKDNARVALECVLGNQDNIEGGRRSMNSEGEQKISGKKDIMYASLRAQKAWNFVIRVDTSEKSHFFTLSTFFCKIFTIFTTPTTAQSE